MKIIKDERIGKTAILKVGCAAVIFDSKREKILLTKREDNGQWCLPGGGMDAGESATEACIRELWEETRLNIEVVKLIGIYTSPHRIVVYADGNKFQFVSMFFEGRVIGGEVGLSDETTAVGYFSKAEIMELDLLEIHMERVIDAFAEQKVAFIR